jgi:hypothetical protein
MSFGQVWTHFYNLLLYYCFFIFSYFHIFLSSYCLFIGCQHAQPPLLLRTTHRVRSLHIPTYIPSRPPSPLPHTPLYTHYVCTVGRPDAFYRRVSLLQVILCVVVVVVVVFIVVVVVVVVVVVLLFTKCLFPLLLSVSLLLPSFCPPPLYDTHLLNPLYTSIPIHYTARLRCCDCLYAWQA